VTTPVTFTHLSADFIGVAPAKLGDQALVSGLVIAAAGAVGLNPVGSPVVRKLPEGVVAGLLMLDGCHIVAHGFPALGLLLLDILATSQHDVRKALDVFTRRLGATEVRSETRTRG
jgi:S-adenosylmethionine/arginine decarboxylase-like enzyme